MAPSYDRDVLAAALSHMTDPSPLLLAGGTFFLAEDVGGHIVGCGGWSRKQPGTGKLVRGLAHIRQFGVHSGWIGRGVGRALYRWCEDAAQAAGARRLEVFASLNAVGFYAACGFDEIRRVELRMGEGTITAVVMAREI